MTDVANTAGKLDEETLSKIAFMGSTLGPLFLHDPVLEYHLIGELYSILAQANARSVAESWPFVDGDEALEYLRSMTTTASDVKEPTGTADPLTLDFRRLFVGPAKKAAAPWGSVYTDKDQVIFGESTLALRDWLRTHGISIDSGTSDEPEDHIGTLLVLLSWLAEEQPEAIEEFLQLHLLPWAPHFLEEMEDAAEHPFFQGLAGLTRASLEGLQSELDLAVETPRFYR